MYRSEIISDYANQLKASSDFVRTFVTTFQTALVADLERTVAPPLLTELQYEPPQQRTYVFSTPRSMRWYFANKVPKGSKGGNYKRTHGLSQGYKVTVLRSDGAVVLSVRNPANTAYRWTQSKQQTIGHRINGWIPAAQPISKYAQLAKQRAPIVAGQVVRSGRFR